MRTEWLILGAVLIVLPLVFLGPHEQKKVTENKNLTLEEQRFLLELARNTLESYLWNGSLPSVNRSELTPNLQKVQGCFVTLMKHGNLRGCIGHILPQEELWKCVRDNAIAAALYDRRFQPVRYDELKDIEIEISVLSVPEPLQYNSTQELLQMLRPGVDGVVIRYQGRQSTYLPQVWNMLPEKEEFLSRLCMKQGSHPECWKEKDVEIYTYQAFVFHEE